MNLFRRLQPVAARGALPVVAGRAAGDLVGAEVRRRAAALARKTAFDIDRARIRALHTPDIGAAGVAPNGGASFANGRIRVGLRCARMSVCTKAWPSAEDAAACATAFPSSSPSTIPFTKLMVPRVTFGRTIRPWLGNRTRSLHFSGRPDRAVKLRNWDTKILDDKGPIACKRTRRSASRSSSKPR